MPAGFRLPMAMLRGIAGVAATMAMVLPSSMAAQDVALPGRDTPLSGKLEEVFAVGVASGESWETFSNVPAVAFDAQGSLYVLDRDAARVLVFDRQLLRDGELHEHRRPRIHATVRPFG